MVTTATRNGVVTKGLLVKLEAEHGKQKEVQRFLADVDAV